MANNLGGDREDLDRDHKPRFGFRVLVALIIILAGVALAVWRHVG